MVLSCRRPLHAMSLLGFLAARAVPGVEEVAGDTYRRSLRLGHGDAVVSVTLGGRGVRWRLEAGDPRDAPDAERRIRALLDLDADPVAVDAALADDPALGAAVVAAPRRRVPGCVDPAEMAIRAVLGQQVSVAAARTHAARLVAAHGERLPAPRGSVTHTFPTATALAALDPERLPLPRARGRALVGLAAALAGGLDPRDGTALRALPGIGPWTASYVAMRCGDPDVLLETDLGVRRGAAALGLPRDATALRRRAERWRPWRSYAVQHLWSAA